MGRLSNYEIQLIPTVNRRIHLYYADEKNPNMLPHVPRMFSRSIIRGTLLSERELTDYLIHEVSKKKRGKNNRYKG
jgi:hypothetical protein